MKLFPAGIAIEVARGHLGRAPFDPFLPVGHAAGQAGALGAEALLACVEIGHHVRESLDPALQLPLDAAVVRELQARLGQLGVRPLARFLERLDLLAEFIDPFA